MNTRILFTCLTAALTLSGPVHAQQPANAAGASNTGLFDRNLLKDPGAEATEKSEQAAWFTADTYKDKPYRCVREAYGQTAGIFAKDWGKKNDHGANLFLFSNAERIEMRSLVQKIDLTSLGDSIDQGKILSRVAGYMANIGNPDIKGAVIVEFTNVDGKPIQTQRTPNKPMAVQGDQWQLVRTSQSGIIPVGTRYASVYLMANWAGAAQLGGHLVMDDVSFELIRR